MKLLDGVFVYLAKLMDVKWLECNVERLHSYNAAYYWLSAKRLVLGVHGEGRDAVIISNMRAPRAS